MAKSDVHRTEVVDFVAKLVKSNPEMPFPEIKSLGKKQGYNVYPLIMGLAKKQLGIGRASMPKAPKPPKAPKAAAPAAPGVVRRGPGRPPKSAAGGDIISTLQGIQTQLTTMRDALREICAIASRF